MSELQNILAANRAYRDGFNLSSLPMPPGRKIAVVACMDARLDLYSAMGLKTGDAHLIRNAGGLVTDDAIRSLVISYELLGTREFFIVEHTDCGMLTFQNKDVHARLKDKLGVDASGVDFLPFPDLRQSVENQVKAVRASKLIPQDIPVHGLIYHVESGELEHVLSA